MTEDETFAEVCLYTLGLGDSRFIHQYAVDCFAIQSAEATARPMKIAFALAGLCLHLEHNFNGRQVQLAHMALAPKKASLPVFKLPASRGSIRVADILAAPPGPNRDDAIEGWCSSIWAAMAPLHAEVQTWLSRDLDSLEPSYYR
jgi:hypothetical protein